MDEMTIYWITRFDGFIVLFVICMFLSFISIALGIVTWVDSKEHYEEGGVALGKRIVKIASPLSVLFALALVFTPTTKEMIVIKGIPAVVDVAKSHNIGEKAERVCNALVKIIEDKAKDSE